MVSQYAESKLQQSNKHKEGDGDKGKVDWLSCPIVLQQVKLFSSGQ